LNSRAVVVGLFLVLVAVSGFARPGTADAAGEGKAVGIASSNEDVQRFVRDWRLTRLYDEQLIVELREDGLYRVEWYFTPKCWNDPVPCGVAAQGVVAVVNIDTRQVDVVVTRYY